MKRVFFCGVLPSKYSGRWRGWSHFDFAKEKRNSPQTPLPLFLCSNGTGTEAVGQKFLPPNPLPFCPLAFKISRRLGNLLKIGYNEIVDIQKFMLNRRSKYLQIAFNRSLNEVREMIAMLPASEKIIIEAGTPLVKKYGQNGISALKNWWSEKIQKPGYIVADLKCMDRGSREVEAVAEAGASAATCLGLAPIETINEFIKECEKAGIDSMVDMMNIEFPFEILQKLRKLPTIVVLHRGVDENEKNREKQIPHDQIHRIKGTYGNVLISVAGGETPRDVVRTFFNDSDIAVIWRSFYEAPEDTANLARAFLKLVK